MSGQCSRLWTNNWRAKTKGMQWPADDPLSQPLLSSSPLRSPSRFAMYSRSQPQQQGELAYELNVSPRNSIDSTETIQKESNSPSSEPLPPSSEQPAPTPSIRLLFSFLSRRHVPLLLLPAILSSLIAGGIAPFMTFVVGQAFNSFAEFPLSNPTQADKDALLRGVGLAAVELVGLAVGSMALGSITSALWIWVGEINVAAVRRHVYARVAKKEIVWFDLNLGSGDASGDVVGAGGLMAKFSKSVFIFTECMCCFTNYMLYFVSTLYALLSTTCIISPIICALLTM